MCTFEHVLGGLVVVHHVVFLNVHLLKLPNTCIQSMKCGISNPDIILE